MNRAVPRFFNFTDWDRAINNNNQGNMAPYLSAAAEFCHREGLTLLIPPGRYRCTETVDWDGLSGLVVMGASGAAGQNSSAKSPGTWFDYDGPDDDVAYSMLGTDGGYVKGIQFDVVGSHDGPAVVAVSGQSPNTLEFHRCRFGSTRTQLATSDAALRLAGAVRLTVHGCYIEGTSNGIRGADTHWEFQGASFTTALHVESTHFQNLGNAGAQTGYGIANPPDGTTCTNPVSQARRAGVGQYGDPNFMGTYPPFQASGVCVDGGWIGDTVNGANGAYFRGSFFGLTVRGGNFNARNHPIFEALGRCEGINLYGIPAAGGGPLFDFDTNWTSTAYPAGQRVPDSRMIAGIGNSKDRSAQGVTAWQGNREISGSIWHGHGPNGPDDRDLMVENNNVTQTLAAF